MVLAFSSCPVHCSNSRQTYSCQRQHPRGTGYKYRSSMHEVCAPCCGRRKLLFQSVLIFATCVSATGRISHSGLSGFSFRAILTRLFSPNCQQGLVMSDIESRTVRAGDWRIESSSLSSWSPSLSRFIQSSLGKVKTVKLSPRAANTQLSRLVYGEMVAVDT